MKELERLLGIVSRVVKLGGLVRNFCPRITKLLFKGFVCLYPTVGVIAGGARRHVGGALSSQRGDVSGGVAALTIVESRCGVLTLRKITGRCGAGSLLGRAWMRRAYRATSGEAACPCASASGDRLFVVAVQIDDGWVGRLFLVAIIVLIVTFRVRANINRLIWSALGWSASPIVVFVVVVSMVGTPKLLRATRGRSSR
jgi:hypothetical protein